MRRPNDDGFLLRTPAGLIFKGDRVRFTGRVTTGGWMTARSADEPLGRWVNGTDDRGRARSIRTEYITRIVRKAATDDR